MCGILGCIGECDLDPAVFGRALDVMAHRGPDDRGIYSGPGVLLGHRPLAILDLSPAGHQPMVHQPLGSCEAESGACSVIVYNGEIYNFRELRRELEKRGERFRSDSDTEVILKGYAVWGPDAVKRLRGIFAFGIWDAARRRLVLARDPLGVKPLYYVADDGFFACASEIRALLALRPDLREVDPIAVHRYLTFFWCPGEGSGDARGVSLRTENISTAAWAGNRDLRVGIGIGRTHRLLAHSSMNCDCS